MDNLNEQTEITTSKEEYVRVSDGEVVVLDNIQKTVHGTKNFWKCYLMDFLSVLGIVDSKQLDIFIYICENTNPSNNIFIGTYKKISADVKVSSKTIATIMKKLQAHNFISKIQNGVWMVNPNLLMKGNENKRQILLSYYCNEEPINNITYSRTKEKLLKSKENKSIIDSISIGKGDNNIE